MEELLLDFQELTEVQCQNIEGGISWNDVGLAVSAAAGGSIGATIGLSVGGLTGATIGGIAGAGVAVAIYSAFD